MIGTLTPQLLMDTATGNLLYDVIGSRILAQNASCMFSIDSEDVPGPQFIIGAQKSYSAYWIKEAYGYDEYDNPSITTDENLTIIRQNGGVNLSTIYGQDRGHISYPSGSSLFNLIQYRGTHPTTGIIYELNGNNILKLNPTLLTATRIIISFPAGSTRLKVRWYYDSALAKMVAIVLMHKSTGYLWIVKYDEDGTFIAEINTNKTGGSVGDMHLDASGNIYFAYKEPTIYSYTYTLGYRWYFSPTVGYPYWILTPNGGLAISYDGTYLITASGGVVYSGGEKYIVRICKVNSASRAIIWAKDIVGSLLTAGGYYPTAVVYGVGVGEEGQSYILFSDPNYSFISIDPNGNELYKGKLTLPGLNYFDDAIPFYIGDGQRTATNMIQLPLRTWS